ncbi:hypothetical protein KUCAC02_014438 [Chaenocephalus aceratus]|uniref:Uncharacterized protein n=1 Tax=Chaenocephalus aceratus TaxID=36190 RepID=A0ACB9WEU9_CHAAC|nr:hypothetical protein KUCAC02_014438 [Chaenocephalus aceratus]
MQSSGSQYGESRNSSGVVLVFHPDAGHENDSALASHRAYLLTARIPAKPSLRNTEPTWNSLASLAGLPSGTAPRLCLRIGKRDGEGVQGTVCSVEHCFNYLEIQGIACNKPTQLFIEYERGSFSLKLLSTEEVNEVVAHIGNCLLRICPGLPPSKVMKKLTMEPPDRLTSLQTCGRTTSRPSPDPVDVDTIYLTQDTRELNLQDFSHLENRDLVAIIAVLEFNQWFTKLSTKDYKLSADVCEQILRVVTRSSRLEELVLDNAGLKTDFAQKLAAALAHNPSSGLTTINLANNPLEDRGISSLGAQFAKLRMGLKHLNFSKTSLSPKGLLALLRGSVPHSRFLMCQRASFLTAFLQQCVCLNSINVSGTKLPPEALKALLLGLASNLNLKEVTLDLSCCELRSGGSQILEGCIAEIPNISSLDISDNGLDSDLATLLVSLAKNRSIRHLSLGKNFTNIKSKNLGPVLDSLVHMIQEEESMAYESSRGGPLTSLSLADSRLKSDLTIVLNALGSNSSLTRLDIGGNAMGDMGAKMLAKALQITPNSGTNTSPQGLQDVAAALEKNFTIRFMPIPIIDASQALKASPEKTEDALLKIESYLYRNHETRKYLQEQAYRLQQGIVTTTTQQMIDRICVKVQDHLNSLKNSETDVILEDVRTAENLIKDARNSKTLLPNLYHLGSAAREEVNSSSAGPIQEKLESMAGEVTSVMDQQLQTLLESMVDAAESLCPHVMKRSTLRPELMQASSAKMVVPKSFVTKTLLEQSGVDIINKISEVKLSLASFLSDRIVDEILEALSTSQLTLADHLVRRGRPLMQQGSVDLDVPEEKIPKRASTEILEGERLEDLETCMMTPKTKRKSIHSRMLRPVSRAFEMEFDLDRALEDVPVLVEESSKTPTTPSQMFPKLEHRLPGGMVELPSEEEKKLQHFTKLRPRRNKKKHSSKIPQINSAPSQDGEQNGLMGRVDEGVDEFFSTKVTRMDSKRSKGSESQDGEKKKKGGFLNLIKRSTKSDKSDKSEKNQATPAAPGTSSALAPATIPEEPSSPKVALKSPALEPRSRDASSRSQPTDYSSSSDRSEELRTPDSMDEPWECLDGRWSPQGGRRYPALQMMGSGLLAEMKAKQERRAYKSSSPDRPESNATAKPQPTNSESRSSSGSNNKPDSPTGSPEKTSPRAENKPDRAPRLRATSSSSSPGGPFSPKPPVPQGAKPALAARPTIPQKPRTSSTSRSIDDISDLPSSGPGSPKVSVLPSTLKKTVSEKEKEGQTGLQSAGSANKTTQDVRKGSVSDSLQRPGRLRVNSEDHGSFKTKDQCPKQDEDKAAGNKSSDSGEEADKDFILI